MVLLNILFVKPSKSPNQICVNTHTIRTILFLSPFGTLLCKHCLSLFKVIEQRLVSSPLPLQMRNLTIENGYVTFTVENEFEASLTLTGDGPTVPWRLLKLRILVQDKETGEGKALVHTMQVLYLPQLCRIVKHKSVFK